MQREQRFEQVHVRVLPPRQLHLRAARREFLVEAAMPRVHKLRLHGLPRRVGKLDRARVVGGAEVPRECEQHEGVVVGVARVVERRAFHRGRAEPAAVGRARGAHQKRDGVRGSLAESRIAVEQAGVAEHIGEAGLHQRGAPLVRHRRAERVDVFEKAPGRIVDAREPVAADVVEQPRPQRVEIVRIEHRHHCVALPPGVSAR